MAKTCLLRCNNADNVAQMIRSDTLIIGAGPSGLAVAGRLRQAGRGFEMIEMSDRVADSWHNHYDRLHLHTVKQLSHLPGVPFPHEYPTYVPREQLVDYYLNYALQFDIKPRFGEEVQTVRRTKRGWVTCTTSGLELVAENVVFATGVNRVPNTPSYPGMDSFGGTAIHSLDYRNPATFLGQRVLVIGMGNTGAEIALDLSEHGIDATISVRSPVNIVPRDVLGRPTQLTARTLSKLPDSIGDRIGVLLRKVTVGNLDKYGIATPTLPPAAQLRIKGKTPVIDVGTLKAIKSGAVPIMPGIERFEGSLVGFADGRTGEFDAVIFATGYRAQVEDFLDESIGLLDENGVPADCIGSGPYEGLFFVGFDNYQPGGILGTVLGESERVVDKIVS